MRNILIASALILAGCSLETKDGCTSSGDQSQCEPTQKSAPPEPTPTPTPDPKEPDPKPPVTAVKCTATAETGTGCVWGQVASGGSSLRIGESLFSDANDFSKYITHMLYEVGEDIDVDSDGSYLTFKAPREVTNAVFVSKFKATLSGPEIKNPIVYPEQGNLVASKLLPGDYSLRVYASFDLVERAEGKIVVTKCLRLENKTSEIAVVAGEQTLLRPIDSFTLSLHDGSCSDSVTSYRDVVLPPKQQIELPDPE